MLRKEDLKDRTYYVLLGDGGKLWPARWCARSESFKDWQIFQEGKVLCELDLNEYVRMRLR